MQALDIRDFEIERRLDAFARTRLTAEPQAVARTRARVMREARLQFEAARIAAHVVPAMTLASRRSAPHRLAMPVLAASLWLGIAVGSVAAAQAGGPLYAARLWAESATLPGNATDRAAAEIARLDARLGDAMTGAAHGDPGAVAAALAAYRQIADEAVVTSTGDERLEDLVSAALDRHRGVLTAVGESLQSSGDTTASAAVESSIQRAIEHNTAVVAALAGPGTGQPTGVGDGGATGAGGGDGTGAGTGDGGSTGGSGSGTGATGGQGGSDGQGATGGSSGGGNGAANGADNGNTGNGQGGNKPPKEPKPTPTDGATHDGQDQNE